MELPRVIRRARRRRAHPVFLDESGFMLTPTVRRTLAPRGKTPILRSWDRHDRISAISALTVSPSRRHLGPYFRLLPDDANVHGEDTVEFLRELRRQLPVPLTIPWDRGNVHDRSKAVRTYLAAHPAIETVALPGYAPEANPDEGGLAAHQARPAGQLCARGYGRIGRRAGRGAGAAASQAEAPRGVHPTRGHPDPVTVVVPLAMLESVRA